MAQEMRRRRLELVKEKLRLKNRGHEVQLDEDILRFSGLHME
jgi:hypothetical protein